MNTPASPVLALIGLGANLGNAPATLQTAARTIASNQGQFTGCTAISGSHLYRSAPYQASGPDYWNAVLLIRTSLEAITLLHALQTLELTHGRKRPVHHAPRTLDLDLLSYGEQIIDTDELQIPHPRLTERRFVLEPLVEIAPETCLPGHSGNASEWLRHVQMQAVTRTDLRLL